jgi:hypothetical protein
MESCQQALVSQALYIATHGLKRDAKSVCQLLHRHRTLILYKGQQCQLPGVGVHGCFDPGMRTLLTLKRMNKKQNRVNTDKKRKKRNNNSGSI